MEGILLRVSPRFVERVPIHFARQFGLIGVESGAPGVLEVHAADESLQSIVDNLALTLECETRLCPAPRNLIEQAINRAYQQQGPKVSDAIDALAPPPVEITIGDDRDLLDSASRAPVIQLANALLFEAAQRRASDLHVQPAEAGVVVRLRIDGVLFDFQQLASSVHEELISRIKVMGGMDVAEQRLPQDGRATVRIGQRLIDLRISIIPTTHGERAVIRLLDKGARLYELDELGMAADVLVRFRSLVRASYGMLLMTGPTGSGKSTTLYSALQRIDYRRLNVVTLEDPIEYHLNGVSQTQVSARKGMTFASGLRSVLRQDPDVIMVGEIRDTETARLAVQSALTGHLVLSTLHTNDAAGAVARLLDLGIEPYLVADCLLGVGAQRLVRRCCARCRTRAPIDADARALGIASDAELLRGAGCDACHQTGYHEREGIFELLPIDDAIRELIHARAPAGAIRSAAVKAGMRALRMDGVRKTLLGVTTPSEVLRVTQGVDSVGEG